MSLFGLLLFKKYKLVDSLIILDNKNQMIKNSHYTYDYFQPEEYHFSLDSVFLAQRAAKLLDLLPNFEQKKETGLPLKVLDLCAGCGIIGLELSLHSSLKLHIDFLEIQEIYKPYFEKNLAMIYPDKASMSQQYKFINSNYQSLLSKEHIDKYDLIVSNPPYFFQGEGLLSPSEFKNRCRFFIDSDFKTLIQATVNSLNPSGLAFLLVRNGTHHGRVPLNDMNAILGSLGNAKIIDNVRGTDIIQIEKKSR